MVQNITKENQYLSPHESLLRVRYPDKLAFNELGNMLSILRDEVAIYPSGDVTRSVSARSKTNIGYDKLRDAERDLVVEHLLLRLGTVSTPETRTKPVFDHERERMKQEGEVEKKRAELIELYREMNLNKMLADTETVVLERLLNKNPQQHALSEGFRQTAENIIRANRQNPPATTLQDAEAYVAQLEKNAMAWAAEMDPKAKTVRLQEERLNQQISESRAR
jgi:hypothetical protein